MRSFLPITSMTIQRTSCWIAGVRIDRRPRLAIAGAGPKRASHPDISIPDVAHSTAFDIDVMSRTVFVRFERKVTVAQIRNYARRLHAHPEFDPKFSEIVDLRGVDDLDLKAPDFLTLADEIDCFSRDSWRAFVVQNSVQNHAARMHKILRLGPNMKIFSSVEQAKSWLASRPAKKAPAD